MPQNQRLRVWKGELKKTSGGLTKDMLMKNKRGKVVSKSKSEAAKNSDDNNLGSWLRSKGDKFEGDPKGLKKEVDKDKKEVAKKVHIPKKVVNKDAKKKVVNAVKVVKDAKKEVVNAVKKVARTLPKGIGPMKAGEEKSADVSVGNIIVKKSPDELKEAHKKKYLRTGKMMKKYGYTKERVIKALGPLPPGLTWVMLNQLG